MHPIHDVDALLLLALTLAAKRRPAELAEIIAATDFLQVPIPSAAKLVEAFGRLAAHGLIGEAGGGYALTPAAQKIMSGVRSKGETPERIFAVKEKLHACTNKGDHPPLLLGEAQVTAAIEAHRAFAGTAGKNLLMPKPKPPEEKHRPGQRQRKPLPARRRRP